MPSSKNCIWPPPPPPPKLSTAKPPPPPISHSGGPLLPAATLSIWSSVSRTFSAPAGSAQNTSPKTTTRISTESLFMVIPFPVGSSTALSSASGLADGYYHQWVNHIPHDTPVCQAKSCNILQGWTELPECSKEKVGRPDDRDGPRSSPRQPYRLTPRFSCQFVNRRDPASGSTAGRARANRRRTKRSSSSRLWTWPSSRAYKSEFRISR